jgi:hypothetical protein
VNNVVRTEDVMLKDRTIGLNQNNHPSSYRPRPTSLTSVCDGEKASVDKWHGSCTPPRCFLLPLKVLFIIVMLFEDAIPPNSNLILLKAYPEFTEFSSSAFAWN